jgi:hypothetical protein
MIDTRLSKTGNIRMVSLRDDVERYRQLFPERMITPWPDSELLGADIKTVVCIKDADGTLVRETPPVNAEYVYSVEPDGRLKLLNKFLDQTEDPVFARHVFNAFAPPHAEGAFSLFPYSYLFRYPGIGDYNEFGHRVTIDYHALEERPAQHKVIAFFGGSACWSIYCYDDEVFTHRLEKILNSRYADEGVTFTVLNFGLPGNVVLNEIITYVLHCHRLQPDIVVAHDGFNDLFYGLTSDPYLVTEHEAVYQFNIEQWAKLLLESWCEENKQPISLVPNGALMQPQMPLQPKNLPQHVLRAYVRRKRQFCDVVKALGGEFVWGIQPYIYSRSTPSEEEKRYLLKLKLDQTVSGIYKHMPFLYEKLLKEVHLPDDIHVADIHSYFDKFDSAETLFADFCHLTPAGDQRIAEFYADFIQNRIIPIIVAKAQC